MDRLKDLIMGALRLYVLRTAEPIARQIAARVKVAGSGVARQGVRVGRLTAIGVTGLMVLLGLMVSGFVLFHVALVMLLLEASKNPLAVSIVLMVASAFYTLIPLIILLYGLSSGLWRGIEDKTAEAIESSVDQAVNNVFPS